MRAILQKLKSFFSDDRGATAVEYALFVAAIAAVIVAEVTSLGQRINAIFTTFHTAFLGA